MSGEDNRWYEYGNMKNMYKGNDHTIQDRVVAHAHIKTAALAPAIAVFLLARTRKTKKGTLLPSVLSSFASREGRESVRLRKKKVDISIYCTSLGAAERLVRSTPGQIDRRGIGGGYSCHTGL